MSKKLGFIFGILMSSMSFFAQNHATINKVEVSYKPAPTGTSTSLADIQCIPQATITLQSNANVSKIYFKILNMETNEVLYTINYNLSANAVTNQDGIVMFSNDNGSIRISSGQVMMLKPYLYKVQTEDSQSQLSAVLTETH